ATVPMLAVSLATVYLAFLLGQVVAAPADDPTGARRVRAGLGAALLWASLLTQATFANLWMAEMLWSGLFALGLLCLLRWGQRPRLALAGWAGVLIGLATLTRSLPMFFVPVIGLWMALRPLPAAIASPLSP